MSEKKIKNLMGILGLIGFVGIMGFIFMINQRIEKSLENSKNKFLFDEIESLPSEISVSKRKIQKKQDVIKVMRLDPSRKFYECIFSVEGKEIARNKISNDSVFDQTGEILDGKVSFKNVSTGTTGEEYYRKNKRQGTHKEFYKDGRLWKEKRYFYGNLKEVKEYYIDGQLRMYLNTDDAMIFGDDREAGTGQIYYRDGILMYEWHLTNQDDNRYKSCFNIKGELVETKLYDRRGELVETLSFR